ncbi:hypothetical protein AAFF_G00141760 [Aldrovandia affinis]|uniref:Uncharacterized protein n=1 Tax=Aldrovandia affinis TaxID=143900 RepID=A0AAD7X2V0_9TELE|nr:hypothetical protein AAFF_G00141760 [Aldrovandia affinis]
MLRKQIHLHFTNRANRLRASHADGVTVRERGRSAFGRVSRSCLYLGPVSGGRGPALRGYDHLSAQPDLGSLHESSNGGSGNQLISAHARTVLL